MKRAFKHTIILLGLSAATLSFSINALASDFNLPFVNAAGLGNMYSGWAASAEDASTVFTNPAGLTTLGHQQLVIAGIGVKGASQFSGTAKTALFPLIPAQTGVASTKLSGFIPTLYYASPEYRFDYALGFTIQASQQWMVRTGLMILTKPSNDRDRSVVDPIGGAAILSVGAHYQQNPSLGYDVGYAHGFFQNANINLNTPLYSLSGHSSANTHIMAAQLTWNMT